MPCRVTLFPHEIKMYKQPKKFFQMVFGLQQKVADAGVETIFPDDFIKRCETGYDCSRLDEELEIYEQLCGELCEITKSLTIDQQDFFLFDGRNNASRKYANWWEKHKEYDRMNHGRR